MYKDTDAPTSVGSAESVKATQSNINISIQRMMTLYADRANVTSSQELEEVGRDTMGMLTNAYSQGVRDIVFTVQLPALASLQEVGREDGSDRRTHSELAEAVHILRSQLVPKEPYTGSEQTVRICVAAPRPGKETIDLLEESSGLLFGVTTENADLALPLPLIKDVHLEAHAIPPQAPARPNFGY